jgi:hypothetical protein
MKSIEPNGLPFRYLYNLLSSFPKFPSLSSSPRRLSSFIHSEEHYIPETEVVKEVFGWIGE